MWLDQIRRSLITSGELERLERELSLRGVTSNPAIFEKAILGSTDYDEQIAELAEKGMSAREIYDEIAILDVQLACDVLRPVWDEANGADGFVSLEVEPAFALDTEKTIAQARDYWDRVDRPNLMVKIPGTEEGVPAIEETVAAGINVNVTLLFSVESYETIAEAYIRGMERRKEAGESLDVHSVASFFVSRVDTEVDKRLAELGKEDLRGIAAVANARAAYMRFKELFYGDRFAALREAGAPVQRPLWASTGVKDPHYPETKYVGLAGGAGHGQHDADEHAARLRRAARGQGQHGRPGSVRGPEAARGRRDRHGRRDEEAAAGRHRQVRGAVRRPDRRDRARPRGHRHGPAEDDRVGAAGRPRAARSSSGSRRRRPRESRSGSGRGTSRSGAVPAWPRSATGSAGSRSATRCSSTRRDLHAFAEQARADGLEHAVLLGMGGSSLGPEVIRRSYGDVPDGLRLHVLDSTDPGAVLATERAVDLDKTLFIVSSKSGGTIETLSHMRYFYERTGGDGSRFCAVTDPGSPLVD